MVLAADGLLERDVRLKTGQTVTVPVVPNGLAGANGVTWRRACYNAVHCGVLGAHRSAEVTTKDSSRERFGGPTSPRTWLLGWASAWPVSKAGHVPRRSKRAQ